ncbi:MAG: nucleoside recognition protein [Ignavibacteriae bacterium]|nr:nucleoside recognition protein [Ignavibacteriota bacterium]
MLNYVWLALLILGIGAAVVTDVVDQSNNKFGNGKEIRTEVIFTQEYEKSKSKTYEVKLLISKEDFNRIYNQNADADIEQTAKLSYDNRKEKYIIFFEVDNNSPKIWQEIASISGKEKDVSAFLGQINFIDSKTAQGTLVLEEVSFAKMKEVTNSALDYAGTAVNIALGLIGIMALWLGVMKVAEEAGLIRIIAKAVRPITRRLFPDVPHDHPAMGSMIMNISANMLGLGNAATPFGLKAMEELEKLNPNKGTATNAMCTFLTVNTAGLTLIPATAIAIRASAGSSDPAIIIGTSIFGAICATTVGITASKILEKFPIKKGEFGNWISSLKKPLLIFSSVILAIVLMAVTGLLSGFLSIFSFLSPDLFKSIVQIVSILAIPMLIFVFIGYGALKKVKIYEVFVEGAKEGFNVAVRIIPYLVAMLVAIGIFRAGGAMEWLIAALTPLTNVIGMPAEALPMALMRPLSGSGSLGIMAEIMAVYGPDSFIGILTSTFFGSTETTFYVLAVYFGSVNIRNTRHALAAGLLADISGILGAVFIVRLLFG